MSSQADSGIGQNAVMCYFPTLPYYLSYQIGFDIIINPPEAQADPSLAGESQRLIHVELFFPDGFMCNPATFAGMAHPPLFESEVPHFFPAQPHFCPPMFPDFPQVNPHFDHHLSMGFEEPMMCQEHLHARMFAYVANGQLGEIMEIDHRPYNIIRRCNRCREFHSVQDRIHNQQPRSVPKGRPSEPSHEQPGHSRKHPSTSGITRHSGTSRASPRKANKHVATDNSRRGTSHASRRAASERVAKDRKNHLRNEDTTISIKTIQGDLKTVSIEGVNGMQGENYTITVIGSQPTDEIIAYAISLLEIFGQNNDDNVPKDKKKTNEDRKDKNDK